MSWKIFPITPGAKTPALEGDWRKHATSDPHVIEGWRAAGYDLAVDCGASGLFVIDIDGEEGERNFLEVAAAQCPPTYSIRTPRGGRHLYYAGVGPSSVGTKVSGLAAKIDTRGQGGYVVWEGPGYELDEAAPAVVAPLPAWVLPALNQRVDHKPAATSDQDTPWQLRQARAYIQGLAPVVQGQGADATTYQLAATLKDLGVSEDKAVELMLELYDCQPQDERYEAFIERKVNNAYHYGQNEAGAKAISADPLQRFGSVAAVGLVDADENPYRLWDIEEIEDEPPVSWLVDNIIPAETHGVFYGPKKQGKTFVVAHLVLPLAVAGKNVLYYSGEGGKAFVQKRLKAWREAHTNYPTKVPHFKLNKRFPNIMDADQVNRWMDGLEDRGFNPDVMVIDTYARVMSRAGLSENDPLDVGKYVNFMEEFKEQRDCTVITIAHSGKDLTKKARGATTLLDAADFSYEVTADWPNKAIHVRGEDMKDAEPVDMFFEAVPRSDSLILSGITESEYRKLTHTQDLYHASSIGLALAKLRAGSEEHAVTAYVLARMLHHPKFAEPELETSATTDRIARKLAALGKGRLEQYCHGQKWWVPEDD